jgi:hypothetical protein
VDLLAVKLLLAPTFVVCASLIARRFGPRAGGLVGGLPVVAGPILLVYALAHGRAFAAGAAVGTLLGLVSLTMFAVVYARLAEHAFWGVSMLAGWLAFCAATAVFSAITVGAGAALAIAAAGLAVGLACAPRSAADSDEPGGPPAWDLPLRAVCALALVLTLTAIAGWLGPRLSGLLAPFPIIATVLATFTHAQRGVDEVRRLLQWMIGGYGAFALFCFILAVALRPLGVGATFALATAAALLMQALLIAWMLRAPGVAPRAVAPSAAELPATD